jgi:glycerol-3-phosphate acyltransferase PlsX
MRIAVDAMGSDHGPAPIVAGAAAALDDLAGDVGIDLVGREAELSALLAPHRLRTGDRLRLRPASEVVEMSDPPLLALRRKRDSSIRRAADLLAAGEVDGVVSAGSTGAVVATMTVVVGLIAGVERAAIGAVLPARRGSILLIDAGANLDCRAEWLVQFAVMGRLYSEVVLGVVEPRVALLSVGEEGNKGNELTRAVFARLSAAGVGFTGNIEGKDMLSGRADVVVCDGFLGNVVLKLGESLPPHLFAVIAEEVGKSPIARVGMWLARPALRQVKHRLDWETYGGAPLLGVDGACIICHGRSGPRAIRAAVRMAADFVSGGVKERIAVSLKGVA